MDKLFPEVDSWKIEQLNLTIAVITLSQSQRHSALSSKSPDKADIRL